jgi:hypothetical protein
MAHSATTFIPVLARQIQSDLWVSAAMIHTGEKPTFVHKQKSSSGTWKYTIEDIDGTTYEVTRFNCTIVEKKVSSYNRHQKRNSTQAIALHA